MANDCVKIKEDGDHLTGKATGAITGKRFVYISGARTSGGIAAGTIAGSGTGHGLSATAEGSVYQVAQMGAGQAGQRGLGVAAFDAAINTLVTVIREGVVPITAGAAITAGQELMIDAQGRVIPWVFATSMANAKIGMALDAQANVGQDVEVLLYEA